MDSEPAYDDGVVLLAERGELSAGEVAEIERFGMDGRERLAAGGYLHENAVRADVELAERMREALNLVAEPVITTKRVSADPDAHPDV
jgi:hypothetical protein